MELFLRSFYAAQRAFLERQMLFGRARRTKEGSPDGQDNSDKPAGERSR